jgi:hypothetical protein
MNELLPWLRSQFEKFPRRLQIEFSNNMVLVQVLQNITTGDGYLDLQMTNQLKTAYGLIESADEPAPKSEFTNKEEDRTKVELFVGENTLQQLLSVSHRSNLFVTNFTSPFLTTKCALFCIGKLVPQMKSLPVVSLFAVV